MWESLATTHRQDRVLHGVAKVANLVVGLAGLPVWLIGQWLSTRLRRFMGRLERVPRPLPTPAPRERTMDALWADLQGIPSRMRHDPTAELRKGLADVAPFVLSQHRGAINLGYSYPAQFTDHVFESLDGERISASIGLQDRPGRPGLVVVHGLFTSRRFDYVRDIAVTAYYEWGFNVAAIDLRSFGITELVSPAPNTGGWKEGEDVVAAGLYLKQLGSSTAGALGISLGGSSVLNASYTEGAEEALDGGIIAVCGPADPRMAAERLSRKVPRRHPAYPINRAFRAMLVSRVRSSRWHVEVEKMADVVEHMAAPYYGLSAEEIWERSAARNHIHGAKVPLLVLHPSDDQIIKVEHARAIDEATADNDNVRVWVLPGGGHGALDAVDREWTFAVYRTFFERWARYPDRPPAEVVYSPDEDGKVALGG